MLTFDNYTVIVYETAEEHYSIFPKQRFVAYLKEIPEVSLHEYGSTQEQAIKKLRKEFKYFYEDCLSKGLSLPVPTARDKEEYSGKIVLRMPHWLHAKIAKLAEEQEISINSYIVHQLIHTSTVKETIKIYCETQKQLLMELQWDNLIIHRGEVNIGKLKHPLLQPKSPYLINTGKAA